jgi:hypothetical protein
VIRRVPLLGAAALFACAPPHAGFSQFAELDAAPDRACLQAVAESVADPDSVSIETQRNEEYVVEYLRGGAKYGMQVAPRGSPPFFAHYGWADREAPAAGLRQLRDQLREVTRLVQDRCGVVDLARRVKEQCSGDHCPELETPPASH